MLYLAAVDKGSFRIAKIQLLAKQVSDRSWVAVNDEALPIEDSAKFNAGMLILAEINASRQVMKIREASREIVGTLQAFSRILEKSQGQEEEIEQWKQSLTFQSQELNRREVELETREEQLQQLDEQYQSYQTDLSNLQAQRVEIETQEKTLSEQQQAMGEQRRQLNEQLTALQERQQQLQALESDAASRLDSAEAQRLQTLSQTVSQSLQINDGTATQALQQLQTEVSQRLQTIDASAATLQSEQQQHDTQTEQLNSTLNDWTQHHQQFLQIQQAIADIRAEIGALETAIAIGDEHLAALSDRLRKQDDALSHWRQLLATRGDVLVAEGFDGAGAVPQLSPEELEAKVASLRRDYEQHAQLVEQQVSELQQNHHKLDELQKRLETASDGDRFDIEMDIDYAKSACSTLEVSLAPQQRALEKKQQELTEQEGLLKRLRGDDSGPSIPKVDLGPLLQQLDSQRQWCETERQTLTANLDEKRTALQQQQGAAAEQQQQADSLKQQLEQGQADLWQRCQDVAGARGRTAAQQAHMQDVKELLAKLQTLMGSVEQGVGQYSQATTAAHQNMEALQSAISALVNASSVPAGVAA
ncbi:MAG: pilus motility taxis protein HmpF [Synechococcus sp.]